MPHRTSWLSAALIALTMAPVAWGAQLGFLRFTPASFFTDEDWDLATTQFQEFIATQRVGAEFSGENPDTGSTWKFRILSESEEAGQPCRDVTITLDARRARNPGRSAFVFCQQPDESWRMFRGLH